MVQLYLVPLDPETIHSGGTSGFVNEPECNCKTKLSTAGIATASGSHPVKRARKEGGRKVNLAEAQFAILHAGKRKWAKKCKQ